MLTDSETTSERLHALSYGEKLLKYFRFNIGLEKWIGIDDWEVKETALWRKEDLFDSRATLLESLTEKYLAQNEVAHELRQCAELLVAGVVSN
jgi:hypothetical protein